MTATCAICGTTHEEDELELSYGRPDAIFDMPTDERSLDVYESDDACVIDDERFFLRATLPLPVHGRSSDYHIGVWVEVGEEIFHRVGDLWDDPLQAAEPPMKGTLANEIRLHGHSLGEPLLMQLTGPATRPQVFISDRDHSLGREQREGISTHRASEYSAGLG
ncbi:MAG: DUF2199 domain-containing protein [Luteibacter sp.]|jgi:hypothetical protein